MSKSHLHLMDQTEVVLRRRIEEFDEAPSAWQKWIFDAVTHDERRLGVLLEQFIRVMRRWTDVRMEMEGVSNATIAPGRADNVVCCSRLLAEIECLAPTLIYGPVDIDLQQWTTTGMLPSNGSAPSKQRFVTPDVGSSMIQPVSFGLWTSTACVAKISMWRAYLEPARHRGGYPEPWYTWLLRFDPGAKVAEIVSATKWVEFVGSYPWVSDHYVYPDWAKIAQEFDAVHMTLPAIAATQGFHFTTRLGVIPPPFWDVESTVWVRWCVLGARLAGVARHRSSELP